MRVVPVQWRWFLSLVLVLTLGLGGIGNAQLPFVGFESLEDLPSLLSPSTALNVGRVTLDGRLIFQIATLHEEDVSVSVREQTIESRLRQVARTARQAEQVPIISAARRNNQVILQADDTYLFTVTSLDAELHGATAQQHATTLLPLVRQAIERYQHEREPRYLAKQAAWLGASVVALFIGSRLLRRFQRLWRVQLKALEESFKANALDPRLIRYEIRERLGELGQVLIWLGIPIFALGLFPQSRPLQDIILHGVGRRLFSFSAVILVTYGALRLGFTVIDYIFLALQNNAFLLATSNRLSNRLKTLISVVKSAVSVIIIGTGILLGLTFWNINPVPLLAGAGILGFAISFGAQNLIKDVINGFFILLEDQYSIGDVIATSGVSGFVEAMNLRITQIRSADGNLITIPNGTITVVENLTNGFSRANLGIQVAYSTDLDRAIAVIAKEADAMTQEPGWRELIVNPPLVLGVDEFGDNSVTIRIWIDTQPLQQWNVAREFRLRLKKAFDKAGISIPFPQRAVWFRNTLQTDLQTEPRDET